MAVTSNDILQNILLSINTALQDTSLTEDNRGALIEQYERTSVLIASGYKYVDIAIDDLPSRLRDESLVLINDILGTFNSTFQTLINSQTASHNTLLQSTSSSVSSKIAELESWQNANDVEKIHKFQIDLSILDANTMYPVYFRFGNGPTNQVSFGEVNIGRSYVWNRRNPSPFPDNSSTTHIAGLDFRVVGSDHPWSGAGWHGMKVEMYEISYMHTMQLFDNYKMPVYIQAKGDTTFSADNSIRPIEGCPVFSGFYLRGGLLYKGFTKGMTVEPTLITKPTRIYDNGAYNRSEWLAPFPYDIANNVAEINKYGGQ